jgi:hypothetical protein
LLPRTLPAPSKTGWPIGFWWAELTHPYCKFVEHGYKVDIYSPDGGKLQADSWSDPRDDGKLMADDDLISLGFIHSPQHSALITTAYTSLLRNFTWQERLPPFVATPVSSAEGQGGWNATCIRQDPDRICKFRREIRG